MSHRPARRNLRPILWLTVSAMAFGAALALGTAALVLVGSLAIIAALVSIERYPRIRD
jgi:hypothetical protein